MQQRYYTAYCLNVDIPVQVMAQLVVKNDCCFFLRIPLQWQYYNKAMTTSEARHPDRIISTQLYLAFYTKLDTNLLKQYQKLRILFRNVPSTLHHPTPSAVNLIRQQY